MDKIKKILQHSQFKKSMDCIQQLEKDRVFCKHGMDHLLDTARIAWILVLEAGLKYDKELVYAAGLLHDVGKYQQYIDGTPHHISSSHIAKDILLDTGFSQEDTALIKEAIFNHRKLAADDLSSLNYILYKADKLSRPCHSCKAEADCNWTEEKKNWTVTY